MAFLSSMKDSLGGEKAQSECNNLIQVWSKEVIARLKVFIDPFPFVLSKIALPPKILSFRRRNS